MSAERWVETSVLGGRRSGWDPNAGTEQLRNLGKTVRPRVGAAAPRAWEPRVEKTGLRSLGSLWVFWEAAGTSKQEPPLELARAKWAPGGQPR